MNYLINSSHQNRVDNLGHKTDCTHAAGRHTVESYIQLYYNSNLPNAQTIFVAIFFNHNCQKPLPGWFPRRELSLSMYSLHVQCIYQGSRPRGDVIKCISNPTMQRELSHETPVMYGVAGSIWSELSFPAAACVTSLSGQNVVTQLGPFNMDNEQQSWFGCCNERV